MGPWSCRRGPVGLSKMRVEAVSRARAVPSGAKWLREPARRLQTRLRRLSRLVGLEGEEAVGDPAMTITKPGKALPA